MEVREGKTAHGRLYSMRLCRMAKPLEMAGVDEEVTGQRKHMSEGI